LLATRNEGKVRELAAMLAGFEIEVLSLAAFPHLPEVIEDAADFAGNAAKKALAAAAGSGLAALADDSGLVVDALDGEPGLYSARYGGPGLSDAERCELLLTRLAARGRSASPARFVCAMALARPGGLAASCQAQWPGTVRGPRRGDRGFGYDPIFEPADAVGTAATLDPELKNRLSHRGQALAEMARMVARRPELLNPEG